MSHKLVKSFHVKILARLKPAEKMKTVSEIIFTFWERSAPDDAFSEAFFGSSDSFLTDFASLYCPAVEIVSLRDG